MTAVLQIRRGKRDNLGIIFHIQRTLVITTVCYQRFCCKIEFAVIKKLDMDPSKASITDILNSFFFFFMNHTFCVFVRIYYKYTKRMFF